MTSNPGVSVLICTYNGKKNLAPTLEHLAAQKGIENFNVELIVIDNASTDGTAEYVQQKWNELSAPYKLTTIPEPRPGKGNASITGYNACNFDIIIVCDDDNWLCESYLKTAFTLMTYHPNIGVLGGKSEAYFEGEKPFWFNEQQHIFAVGEQFPKNGKNIGFLWGAGMVFRRVAWQKLQQINYTFMLNEQRSGKLNWGGDDTELCEMITVMGYDLWYDNSLCLTHYMPKQRMTVEYLESRYFGLGRARIYLYAYVYCRDNNQIPGSQLKYPFWLDKYLHKSIERIKLLPSILLKSSKQYNKELLFYISLKGELMEIWRIKNGYNAVYEKILQAKKLIAELKN